MFFHTHYCTSSNISYINYINCINLQTQFAHYKFVKMYTTLNYLILLELPLYPHIITVYVLLNVCIDYIEDTENLFGKIKTKYVILYCINIFEPF